MQKKFKYILLLLFILVVFISGILIGMFKINRPTPNYNEKVTVKEVIDGDTVELINGERVRLLGINSPERGQKCYSDAKERLKELVENKTVTLERDENPTDQYNRSLRYIFVNGENINIKLVEEGLASVFIIPPNNKYQSELEKAESLAQKQEKCMWEKSSPSNLCENSCIGIADIQADAEGDDCSNLNGEYITFKNSCNFSCDLTHWTVTDETSRDPYIFPSLVLEGNSEVILYTGCGTDAQKSVYWCSSGRTCNAVWNNAGDTIFMRNEKEDLVLTYEYSTQ